MTPAVGYGPARLAGRHTPVGKAWCGISAAAGPRRSKGHQNDGKVCAASFSWSQRAACFSNRAAVERGKPDPNLKG